MHSRTRYDTFSSESWRGSCMDLVRIQSGIAHFARSFYEKPYGFLVKQSLYPLSHRGLLRASRSDARLRCSQFLVPTMAMLQANRSCACDFHAHAFVLRVRLSCVRFASQKTSPKAYSKKCEGVSVKGAREVVSRWVQRHHLVRHHSLWPDLSFYLWIRYGT